MLYLLYCIVLNVRSLAFASRSRQSEKQPIIVELALIEHAHMGRSFRASRTAAMCHRSSDYYRTGGNHTLSGIVVQTFSVD